MITSEYCIHGVQAAILTDSRFGTKTVIIRVGAKDHSHDFAVYEKLVRHASAFINNALKEPWQESIDRVVGLPDFTKKTFGIYHLWLLTGKLHRKHKPDVIQSPETPSLSLWLELLTLRDLSKLGHYLLDTAFTDTECDAILQCCEALQSLGTEFPITYISYFYKAIPEGLSTRSLIANVIAWTTTSKQVDSVKRHHANKVHPDFLVDMLHAMAKRFLSPGKSISPLKEPNMSCEYHSHGDEKPCYRKKKTGYVTHRSHL
jgi:hypothetical protein